MPLLLWMYEFINGLTGRYRYKKTKTEQFADKY